MERLRTAALEKLDDGEAANAASAVDGPGATGMAPASTELAEALADAQRARQDAAETARALAEMKHRADQLEADAAIAAQASAAKVRELNASSMRRRPSYLLPVLTRVVLVCHVAGARAQSPNGIYRRYKDGRRQVAGRQGGGGRAAGRRGGVPVARERWGQLTTGLRP